MIDIDTSRLQSITRAIGRSDVGVSDAAEALTGEIQKSISGPSPSAPGQPPGQDTGQYQASWESSEDAAFTTAPQGPALEYGTERMAARPHARPAAMGFKEQYAEIVRRALGGLL